jgi:hypothetical protein
MIWSGENVLKIALRRSPATGYVAMKRFGYEALWL